jgi:hypothetical protein
MAARIVRLMQFVQFSSRAVRWAKFCNSWDKDLSLHRFNVVASVSWEENNPAKNYIHIYCIMKYLITKILIDFVKLNSFYCSLLPKRTKIYVTPNNLASTVYVT